jgi:hypothetical protein
MIRIRRDGAATKALAPLAAKIKRRAERAARVYGGLR